MTSRGSRLGVLFVLATAVFALSAAGETWSDHRTAPAGSGDRAVALQSPWVDALVVGLAGADRREPGSERFGKQRLVLWAAAADLLILARFSRRAVVFARSVRSQISRWSPQARAPPSFSF